MNCDFFTLEIVFCCGVLVALLALPAVILVDEIKDRLRKPK